jgi:hypothetical protein
MADSCCLVDDDAGYPFNCTAADMSAYKKAEAVVGRLHDNVFHGMKVSVYMISTVACLEPLPLWRGNSQ